MKSRKFLMCSIVWLLSTVLSGCPFSSFSASPSFFPTSTSSYSSKSSSSSSNQSLGNDLQAMEEVLETYRDISGLDMNYTKTVITKAYNSSSEVRFVTKKVNGKSLLYRNSDHASNNYFFDGCYYTEWYSGYNITPKPDFDIANENPIPFNLPIRDITHEFYYYTYPSGGIYYVTMSGYELKPYIEAAIGVPVMDQEIEMSMELRALKTTKQLESVNMMIQLTDSIETINFEIQATINAIEDQVNLTIPSHVIDRITQYIANPHPVSDPQPEPEPVSYDNTLDGVVKYHDFGSYKKIVYDDLTDQLIVLSNDSIKLYDANNLAYKRSIATTLVPTNVDVDQGKLVVAYKKEYFDLYDLTQESEPVTIPTNVRVAEIAIDQDIVFYSYDNSWCDVIFHNLVTNEKVKKFSMYEPQFTLNRKEHILYVTETNVTTSLLIYYHSQTGQELYRNNQYFYTRNKLAFDGKYVHHDEYTLDRFDGTIYSMNLMNRKYPSFDGFTPTHTIYDQADFALIGSSQYKIGVYDNNNNTFIYQFLFNGNNVIAINNNKYILLDNQNKYVAVVDMGLIQEDEVDDESITPIINTRNVSEDGKLTTLTSSFYTQSVMDDQYIYTINENSYELNVYDLVTLEKVYSESYLIQPISIDANGGKLVIGYGETYTFRIYDTSTWEHEIIKTVIPVYSTLIYENEIIYTSIDQFCDVRVYNITTKTHSTFGYTGYFITMAINRADDLLYIGDRNSTSNDLVVFNLKTKQKLDVREVSSSQNKVLFDGNFVHYAGSVYDKTIWNLIASDEIARSYESDTILQFKTIYDNNQISIFVGLSNEGEVVTIVYDLVSKTNLYIMNGNASHAYMIGDSIVILHDNFNFIQVLTLEK